MLAKVKEIIKSKHNEGWLVTNTKLSFMPSNQNLVLKYDFQVEISFARNGESMTVTELIPVNDVCESIDLRLKKYTQHFAQ